MKNKIKIIILGALLFVSPRSLSLVVVTYKNPEAAIQDRTDFMLTNNRIDEIKNFGDDDFSQQGPYAMEVSFPPTGNLTPCESCIAEPMFDEKYVNNYYKTLADLTPARDFRRADFNLYSGNAFQLSSQPSEFSIDTELFKPDPQLMSILDYYIDEYHITPGQEIIKGNYFQVVVGRKDSASFWGKTSVPLTVLVVTCPKGAYITFDVQEFSSLPTNVINTKTKGCVITNTTLFGVIS
jgi:hypothetical protein